MEEDPALRSQIHLYRDEEAIEAKEARDAAMIAAREREAQRAPAAAADGGAAGGSAGGSAGGGAGGGASGSVGGATWRNAEEEDFGDDEAENDDFPDVGLEELLDELTIGADDEAEADEAEGAASGSVVGGPSAENEPPPVAPVSFAPPMEHFTLPGGNANAKFYF